MTRRLYFLLALCLVGDRSGISGKNSPSFVVIVHPSNRFNTLRRSQIDYLFLRKVSRWPWGAEAKPIDLPVHDAIRQEFTREVLGTSESQLETYWIDQRSTLGLVPPDVVPDAAAAKAFVAARPGAIAYIPAAALDSRVKVVKVEP